MKDFDKKQFVDSIIKKVENTKLDPINEWNWGNSNDECINLFYTYSINVVQKAYTSYERDWPDIEHPAGEIQAYHEYIDIFKAWDYDEEVDAYTFERTLTNPHYGYHIAYRGCGLSKEIENEIALATRSGDLSTLKDLEDAIYKMIDILKDCEVFLTAEEADAALEEAKKAAEAESKEIQLKEDIKKTNKRIAEINKILLSIDSLKAEKQELEKKLKELEGK